MPALLVLEQGGRAVFAKAIELGSRVDPEPAVEQRGGTAGAQPTDEHLEPARIAIGDAVGTGPLDEPCLAVDEGQGCEIEIRACGMLLQAALECDRQARSMRAQASGSSAVRSSAAPTVLSE